MITAPIIKRYFRVVYTSTVDGRIHRCPRQEQVVEAPTLEKALSAVRSSERAEMRLKYGVRGEVEFLAGRETDRADFDNEFHDAALAGLEGPPPATLQEYEARLSQRRRARRVRPIARASSVEGQE